MWNEDVNRALGMMHAGNFFFGFFDLFQVEE
jgi:hypothetical protein